MNIGKIYRLSNKNLKIYHEEKYNRTQKNFHDNNRLTEQDLFILLKLNDNKSEKEHLNWFYLKILFDGKVRYINSFPCSTISELPFEEVSDIVQT